MNNEKYFSTETVPSKVKWFSAFIHIAIFNHKRYQFTFITFNSILILCNFSTKQNKLVNT